MKSLKDPSRKETDNVDTQKLIPILKEFLESIDVPFEPYNTNISELEYQSRDGFIAYGHNRGGLDLIAFTTVANLMGSGEHLGSSICASVESDWETAYNDIKKNDPELDEEHIWDNVYESCSDEYYGYAWRIRIMYEGNNTLCIHVGWDTDAPYYRWHNKAQLKLEIKYKNKADLKRKLEKVKDKIEGTK